MLSKLKQHKNIYLIGLNYKDNPSKAREFIDDFGNPLMGNDLNPEATTHLLNTMGYKGEEHRDRPTTSIHWRGGVPSVHIDWGREREWTGDELTPKPPNLPPLKAPHSSPTGYYNPSLSPQSSPELYYLDFPTVPKKEHKSLL